jgi:hypothetical protein
MVAKTVSDMRLKYQALQHEVGDQVSWQNEVEIQIHLNALPTHRPPQSLVCGRAFDEHMMRLLIAKARK